MNIINGRAELVHLLILHRAHNRLGATLTYHFMVKQLLPVYVNKFPGHITSHFAPYTQRWSHNYKLKLTLMSTISPILYTFMYVESGITPRFLYGRENMSLVPRR